MPSPNQAVATELLYAALRSPCGIAIRTNAPERARALLYAVRRGLADPALAVLQCRLNPLAPGEEVWVLRGEGKKFFEPAIADKDAAHADEVEL